MSWELWLDEKKINCMLEITTQLNYSQRDVSHMPGTHTVYRRN